MSEIIIQLTQGYETVIDEIDGHLAEFKWCAEVSKNTVYAIRRVNSRTGRLHAAIMDAPPGMEVDHRDRDGLNNRRSNLRICTRQQNLMNTPPRLAGSSRYKGVCYISARKKWMAQTQFNQKRNFLGRFDTEIEAALAYDAEVFSKFGTFAWLNRDNFDL